MRAASRAGHIARSYGEGFSLRGALGARRCWRSRPRPRHDGHLRRRGRCVGRGQHAGQQVQPLLRRTVGKSTGTAKATFT